MKCVQAGGSSVAGYLTAGSSPRAESQLLMAACVSDVWAPALITIQSIPICQIECQELGAQEKPTITTDPLVKQLSQRTNRSDQRRKVSGGKKLLVRGRKRSALWEWRGPSAFWEEHQKKDRAIDLAAPSCPCSHL